MNLANQLTMARVLMAVATFLALMHSHRFYHAVALVLFVAAMVTDWVDGYIARTTHTISAFGKIADPIADKILVLGALIALIRRPELEIPLWGVFLILARDLLMGGVRTLSAVKGQVLAAEKWGKWKMGIQSGAIIAMILILIVREYIPAAPAWLLRIPYHLTVLCVLVTWGSAYFYYRQSRGVIESSWG